jgi:ABC-type Fe3+/spermidine/putrescine transport system ATPase subunit
VLKELQRSFDLSVLMVTHDMEEAFFLGDQVSVMIDGAIRQTGAARDVYEKPADTAVASFFGIRNIFSGRVRVRSSSSLQITCDALGADLTMPIEATLQRRLEPGAPCTVGIRPENVMILKPERRTMSRTTC